MIANRIRMKSISVGGGGFQPGDFDFNDGTVQYTTNTVTFTKSGTLCLSINYVSGTNQVVTIIGQYNNGEFYWYPSQDLALTNKQSGANPYALQGVDGYFAVVDVVVNDTLYFICGNDGPFSNVVNITFNLTTFDGTLISDFTVTMEGCYLTTSTVIYKGLNDKGPELTAMRSLREYYRGDLYYDNLITEYYINSPIILQGINSSEDPSMEYEFIYQSVLRVKYFVDNLMWEDAKNEYVNTYFILKDKYIQ